MVIRACWLGDRPARAGFFMRSALGLFVDTTNDTLDYVPADAQLYFAIDLVETARATTDDRIESLIAQVEEQFELRTKDSGTKLALSKMSCLTISPTSSV